MQGAVEQLHFTAEPQGIFRQAAVIEPASTEVAGDAARCSECCPLPVSVQRPDAATEVQCGEALARHASVMLATQLQTAGGGQAELPTSGMKAAMLQRRDQVDRLQMGRALNVQGHLQGLAADIRGGSGDAQASGVLIDAQLQARVAEGVALQRQLGQLATDQWVRRST